MIPKKIHYCWFGCKRKPEAINKYMQSWKENFPDFEIKEWNENNFDVNMMAYTKEAYNAKKYAFVSDVARIFALVNEGGIYFDTDILSVKPFDEEMINSNGFLGFEHEKYITTGVMAVRPNHYIFQSFLDLYKKIHFFAGYRFDMTPNPIRFTDFLKCNYGLVCNNLKQKICDLDVYPQVYFCAKDSATSLYYNNDKTYAIHDFHASWKEAGKGKFIYVKKCMSEILSVVKYKVCQNLSF